MAEFVHSILAADQLIAADGDVVYDLPVNPLSAILLKVAPLNETSTITAFSALWGLLSAVDNIRVTHRGGDVFAMNGVDAMALALLWHKIGGWQSNQRDTDNERRCLVLPILFGRKAWMPRECFPATKKGELLLTVRWDIADTGFDGLRISIETIELMGATPDYVQKCTTLARTPSATGQGEVDLPIGNVLRGILLFGTTAFTGASPAPSLGQMQVLRSNRQIGYSATDFEVARGLAGLMGSFDDADAVHIHAVNAAGAGQEFTRQTDRRNSNLENYVLLPFDVSGDDTYSLDTEGAGRLHVRIDADTADAQRILPIERVVASKFLESP